ncbi:ABC transporter substrate-binding protein [Frigidibacter sp. MR17.24]|uniref:ABC transporter substrate-binding protein n=1 Tax=Frigidibacter sp. MR17.24 TaxID=3127345 RepID=UPI003012C8B0
MTIATDLGRALRGLAAGAAAVAVLALPALAQDRPAPAQDLPVLRLGLQLSGTVNWEVDTIRHEGLDTANGLTLAVQDMAAGPAAQVALQAGAVDAIVSDWLWVARQRADGQDLVFIPYSRAVGGLMVPADSPAQRLGELAGGKIGIAGGPVDKSWLILRAYAERQEHIDLAAVTEQVFGAPPLIYKAALSGELQAAVNFWHFGAKMQAAGMRELISVQEAGTALGLDPGTPLLGYVLRGDVVRAHPGLAEGFAAASRAAKETLATSADAWDRLRPMMNAADDAEFEALKAGFIAGIPPEGPVDEAAAAKMLALMAELGGTELVGSATTLPEGVFWKPAS